MSTRCSAFDKIKDRSDRQERQVFLVVQKVLKGKIPKVRGSVWGKKR